MYTIHKIQPTPSRDEKPAKEEAEKARMDLSPYLQNTAEIKEAMKEEREAKKLAKKSKGQEKAEAKEDRRKGKKSPKEGKRSYEGPSSQICRQEEQ